MKRSIEFTLIVAVSVLTVMTTATVLRDNQVGTSSSISQWVNHTLSGVASWLPHAGMSRFDVKPASSTPIPITEPDHGNTTTSKAAVVPSLPSSSTGISASEIATLQSIAGDFAQSMTPADWTALLQDLSSPQSPDEASKFDSLILGHLSPSDKQWVESHFQGSQAFSPEDYTLLAQTISQLQNSLTPSEQSMLESELSQWLNRTMQSGASGSP